VELRAQIHVPEISRPVNPVHAESTIVFTAWILAEHHYTVNTCVPCYNARLLVLGFVQK
jgi:hypothetical protein